MASKYFYSNNYHTENRNKYNTVFFTKFMTPNIIAISTQICLKITNFQKLIKLTES